MKINKKQLRKLLEQLGAADASGFIDAGPPVLVDMSIKVYSTGGELWVNFEDHIQGGSGNDPLDGFGNYLREEAEAELEQQARDRQEDEDW